MRSSIRRLRQSTEAHSAIEYAVCLGLVGVVILGVAAMIASPIQRAFSLSDAAIGSNRNAPTNAAMSAATTNDRSSAAAGAPKQEADGTPAMIDARILWIAFAV
ncbi:MAG TPA: hypothetical protein VKB78_14015, partial [Pirellulales bacterium]|nr:hypothetical protein [Pirellulales bacterium]